MRKLNIENGIIKNKTIAGIPINIKIVEPKNVRNVRSLEKMKELIGITVHNTANSNPTATDNAHAAWLQNVENADKQYISAHIFVDEDSLTQCIPLDEVAFHAGDGKGDGNRKTIAIEICENADILKAEENAKKLIAALMLTYPGIKLYKHQDWSGKNCPRVILSRPNGWENFKADIEALIKSDKAEIAPAPAPAPAPQTINKGSVVTVNGRLYATSSGAGPGKTLSNYTGKVTIFNPGAKYPYHIATPSGGALGWVSAQSIGATPPAKGTRYQVICASLNVRTGPGINYGSTGKYLKRGDIITVTDVKGNWGRHAFGWSNVSTSYCKKL